LLLALGKALALSGETQRAIQVAAPEALAVAERLQDRRRAFGHVVSPWKALSSKARVYPPLRQTLYHGRSGQTGLLSRRVASGRRPTSGYHLQDRLAEAGALRVEALAIARRTGDRRTQFLAASYLVSLERTAPQFWEERVRLAREWVEWPRDG
jgi:hypothetical protein